MSVDVLANQFPGAILIDKRESIVLRSKDLAIHIYPLDAQHDINVVKRLQIIQNTMESCLSEQQTSIQFPDGRIVALRGNPKLKADLLKDGRVYTESPFISGQTISQIIRAIPSNHWLSDELVSVGEIGVLERIEKALAGACDKTILGRVNTISYNTKAPKENLIVITDPVEFADSLWNI